MKWKDLTGTAGFWRTLPNSRYSEKRGEEGTSVQFPQASRGTAFNLSQMAAARCRTQIQLSTDNRRPFSFTRPNGHSRISQVTSAGDSIEAVDSLNRSQNCLLQNRENEYEKDYCGCAPVA